ncbi:helix-turn-helix domain-containing protein [Bacillus sp. BP-3]|uniref:helix-turn-helix domain-containing protein n=1 Tax=Bacillus sp. BP-3 TaxID=3022773 RepID=UPI00232C3102|nr:helix-turn-helix domain-containing protein [Bacillus sp. BP-3]MDC2865676.1 helix-turn-helix domain-containing protein [Bacillus sp. BP-3]
MSKLYSLMKQHSEFQNKEEFNTYQQRILTQYQKEINKTDFLVIRLLGRYAVNEKQKTVGVACPLMETIAVKIEKNIRTVRRSVAKLERLGIIKRVFTKERHKRGGYSANLYVFRKQAVDRMIDRMQMTVCENGESTGDCKEERLNEEIETSVYENNLKIKQKTKTYNMDATYCRHDIPQQFVNAIAPMSQNPQTINFAWSKVELAYKKSGLYEVGLLWEQLMTQDDIQVQIMRRTKSVVRAYKCGEIRKDFGALLYSTIQALFLDVALEWAAAARRNSGIVLYNPFECKKRKELCV